MKNSKIIAFILILVGFVACDKMEDNYQQYLDLNRVYSPKITDLSATVGLKQATLRWTIPPGDLAKKIIVDYQDDILEFEQMVDSVFLDSLEIKGYIISVFTKDKFNNLSVPTSIQIFPNGEQ